MPTPQLRDAEVLRRVDALKFYEGNYCHAARALACDNSQIRRAYIRALERGLCEPIEGAGRTNEGGNWKRFEDYPPYQPGGHERRAGGDDEQPVAKLPDFGSDDIPIDQLIDVMADRSQAHYEHSRRKDWFPVEIRGKKPIGIAFVGDPHLDDPGMHWGFLKRDLALIKSTPGCFALNVGDTINNWPLTGKLGKQWAAQDASSKTAWRLVKWFMHDAQVPWLLWLLGNHDAWNEGAALFQEMAGEDLAVFDWQAKFRLVFENGRECPIHAAHSFKGSSIYTPGHGMQRAAKFSKACPRLYVQGHHHQYWMHHGIYEDIDRDYYGLKVRGYKLADDYADRHQFGHTTFGSTAMAIINPKFDEGDPGFIRVFGDLAFGCEVLKYLRGGA